MSDDDLTIDDLTKPLASSERGMAPEADLLEEARPPAVARPRIRWAAVIWGALFAAFAVATVVIVVSGPRRSAFAGWLFGLGPNGWTVVGVLALGALMLVLGLAAGLRALTAPRASR